MYQSPVDVAVAALGSYKRVALTAGVCRRTVLRWRKRGVLPVEAVAKLLGPCAVRGVTAEELIRGRWT